MEFVEPEDGPLFRLPPDLDDRIWRHPSELGGHQRTLPATTSLRSMLVVAMVSALGASLLTATLVVAVSTLDDPEPAPEPTSGELATRPITSIEAEPIVAVAELARPSIVQLQVRRGLESSSGSGVIFRSDGHVLTNAHVVSGATSVKAMLANGRQLDAAVVGADLDSDTAVVKIEGGPYPAASLGTTTTVKVGQRAIAIGSPLALAGGPSVTAGVVSALHRTVRTRDNKPLFDMIQTDAPISPGSSGGALFDLDGNVIGITTAIAISDTGPDGLGFATPIELARSIAEQLIATGKATHVWMGIEGNDLDGATAHELDLNGGAIVNLVRENSPAARAGLAVRDVIVAVDGRPVASMGTLVVALRSLSPGEGVPVEVMRDGKRHTMNVVVVERPPNP